MFFKNARIYRLTEAYPFSATGFDEALNEHKFNPCTGQMAISVGFDAPIEQSKNIAQHFGDVTLIAVRLQEKLLPAAVINEELAPRIAKAEAEGCRPLSRKEKQVLKEEIVQCLLPRAFSKSTLTRAIIDQENGLIIIDTPSASRAEDVLALLRKALGSLPVVPCMDANKLSVVMQQWVAGTNLPTGFTRGHSAIFKAPDEEGAVAKFENHLLSADEVQSHSEDKLVTEIELHKPDVMTLRISDNFTLKRIQWHEFTQATNEELGWEDVVLRLSADILVARAAFVEFVVATNNTLFNDGREVAA